MQKYQNLEVYLIEAFNDNYIFIGKCLKSGIIFTVDPGEFSGVDNFLIEKGWNLDFILNTHHHWDHTGANLDLKEKYNCCIVGNKKDSNRIPGIDIEVEEDEFIKVGELEFKIIALSGHTIGHIAYFNKEDEVLFIGDTLFSSGCGYLFEGSYKQMYDSLQKIKNLPKDTKIYCAHECTVDNVNFSLSIEPNNTDLKEKLINCQKLREQNIPTIPTDIKSELLTNPFLRAESVEDFARIRKLKDNW